jgi:hypothetical protein
MKSAGFVGCALGLVLAVGLVAAVDSVAAGTSKPVPKLSSISVSTRYNFEQIREVGHRIELLGLDIPATNENAPSTAKCVSEVLDTETFRLGAVTIVPCSTLYGSTPSVWAVTSHPYTNHTTLRIAHRDPKTGKVSIGPVVMTYVDASDTHLEQITGDGSLWFYDCCTTNGAVVLRVSSVTGQVENVVRMPSLYRPILATNDDGLWIGVATNGGYPSNLSGSPIYHLAPGSKRAKLVFVGGHATDWMVASGHSLWVDIGSLSKPSSVRLSETIWRFDGTSARRVFHTPTFLPFGISVIGNESEGLWTMASQLPKGSSTNVDTDTVCTARPAVVEINPNTGRQHVVATLPPRTGNGDIDCLAQDLEGQQAVINGGYMYLLEDTAGNQAAGFTKLFRIRLDPKGSTSRVGKSSSVVFEDPHELAVSPSGTLYFGDDGLDKIFERLPNGTFKVVAGNGHHGFSGDGDPAVDAELNSIGDMTFASNGTLYFADGNRIRTVSPGGRIKTVVGNGSSSPNGVTNGTPALRASVGSVSGLTFGPGRELYFVGGNNQILRLTSSGTIDVFASGQEFAHLCGIVQLYPTELAFDDSGDLYVSTGNSFQLVELPKKGHAFCVSGLRRAGGSPGALASGPDGTVFGSWQFSIVRIESSKVKTFLSFSIDSVPSVRGAFAPDDIAVAPNGTIFSDTESGNGATNTTAIIAVSPNRHVTTIWASSGSIAGRLLRVGGAAPGTPVGVPGTAYATNVATGVTFQASTTSAGVFTISVPDGTYRLSGRSPQMNGGNWMVTASSLIHLRVGGTARVNLYFQLK